MWGHAAPSLFKIVGLYVLEHSESQYYHDGATDNIFGVKGTETLTTQRRHKHERDTIRHPNHEENTLIIPLYQAISTRHPLIMLVLIFTNHRQACIVLERVGRWKIMTFQTMVKGHSKIEGNMWCRTWIKKITCTNAIRCSMIKWYWYIKNYNMLNFYNQSNNDMWNCQALHWRIGMAGLARYARMRPLTFADQRNKDG